MIHLLKISTHLEMWELCLLQQPLLFPLTGNLLAARKTELKINYNVLNKLNYVILAR